MKDLLTSKAKADFDAWLKKNHITNFQGNYRVIQVAIIIHWMDGAHIVIQIFPTLSECVAYVKEYRTLDEIRVSEIGAFARLRCTEKAIELANKLYNERYPEYEPEPKFKL